MIRDVVLLGKRGVGGVWRSLSGHGFSYFFHWVHRILTLCISSFDSPRMWISFTTQYSLSRNARLAPQADKVRLFGLLPRRVRLDTVDLLKQLLQPEFESLIFSALIELAQKMSAGDECVVAEFQRSQAKILPRVQSAIAIQKI